MKAIILIIYVLLAYTELLETNHSVSFPQLTGMNSKDVGPLLTSPQSQGRKILLKVLHTKHPRQLQMLILTKWMQMMVNPRQSASLPRSASRKVGHKS